MQPWKSRTLQNTSVIIVGGLKQVEMDWSCSFECIMFARYNSTITVANWTQAFINIVTRFVPRLLNARSSSLRVCLCRGACGFAYMRSGHAWVHSKSSVLNTCDEEIYCRLQVPEPVEPPWLRSKVSSRAFLKHMISELKNAHIIMTGQHRRTAAECTYSIDVLIPIEQSPSPPTAAKLTWQGRAH